MARINLLDTRTTSFGDLVGNGKIYRVPLFQRDYAWKLENWEDLWQDILVLYRDPDAVHYMGAIVLQNSRTSDKEFKVIDGQQRLATLSIGAIAIVERIHQLALNDREPEDNQERQEILKRTYLSDRDPRSLRYSSKLILNENNDDFYQSNLINLRPPRNIRALSKSNQLLWQAFTYFSNCIQDLDAVKNSGEALAQFLTEIIAQRLLFIQINVEDELNAYTVFETLNARGIELSATDLLKNYLFSLFQGPDDLQAAQRQWRRIIRTVQMEKFPEFLRYYLSLQYTRVRRERLFKLVREEVKTASQAFDLLDQLEEYSHLFIALSNPNDEFWYDTSEHIPYIRELKLFRSKQAYPTLFAAHKKFSRDNFNRLLKLISVVAFRYTIVSRLNPNELEKIYNTIAIEINQNKISTPRQVFHQLQTIYVNNEKFLQDFLILALSTKGQKKQLVRYILGKLESDAAGVEVDTSRFSIEHILPESPGEIWRNTFSETQIENMVYRLGNLTPLESSLNRQIGNTNFEEKKLVYQRSKYVLTQDIEMAEWTPDTIASRQQRLARRAVHIWQSDF